MAFTQNNYRDANVPYVTASQLLRTSPVYYVKFGLVTGPLGTNSQVLPDEYATGPILNPTKTRKRLMDNPTSVSNEINVVTSETTISSIQFKLMNSVPGSEGEITRIVTNYTMKNRRVTIYAGYQGFTEDQFIPIYSGQINNWQKSYDSTHYIFTVVDALKQLKGTILRGQTNLTRDYVVGDTTIFVTGTDGFAESTDLHDGLDSRNYLRMGDSLYSYDSLTEISFSGIRLVQLNSNGTLEDEDHQAGEDITNYVLYRGNPIDLILQIVLSTGNGTNGDYDILPEGQGIGIPQDMVDITGFESQRDIYVSEMVFSNFFSDQTEALKFFQENILRQVNAYLFINRAGQLDIKLYYVPIGTLDTITLDNTNIIGTPTFDANLFTGTNFFNEIDIKFDYQPVQDFYVNQLLVEDIGSQAKYEERSTLEIDGKMISTFFGGDAINTRMKSIYLSRFSEPPPIITCQTVYGNHLLTPGSPVFLNYSTIPNYVTGKDGDGPILCECVSVSPDFQNGVVNVTLLGIGFNNTKRYAAIGPDNLPLYGSAIDGQRLAYGFITTDAGKMAGGDEGYLITP